MTANENPTNENPILDFPCTEEPDPVDDKVFAAGLLQLSATEIADIATAWRHVAVARLGLGTRSKPLGEFHSDIMRLGKDDMVDVATHWQRRANRLPGRCRDDLVRKLAATILVANEVDLVPGLSGPAAACALADSFIGRAIAIGRSDMSPNVGDLVAPRPGHPPFQSEHTSYRDAVVVSLDPFVLVSRACDMRWNTTICPGDVVRIGSAPIDTLVACLGHHLRHDPPEAESAPRQETKSEGLGLEIRSKIQLHIGSIREKVNAAFSLGDTVKLRTGKTVDAGTFARVMTHILAWWESDGNVQGVLIVYDLTQLAQDPSYEPFGDHGTYIRDAGGIVDHEGKLLEHVADIIEAATDGQELSLKVINPLPDPSTPLTEGELEALESCSTSDEWNSICDRIKDARLGVYPPDWHPRVMLAGVIDRAQARFDDGDSDQGGQ